MESGQKRTEDGYKFDRTYIPVSDEDLRKIKSI